MIIKPRDWFLYAIVDKSWLHGRSAESVAQALIKGGAGLVQYRDKESESGEFYQTASRVCQVCHDSGIPFIVNDRIDVALAVGADGVHLGQKDIPAEMGHRILEDEMILGISISSWEEFVTSRNADYIGVGPLFPTNTKRDTAPIGLELVRQIRPKTKLPIIGIGGITLKNVESAIEAGCNGVAAISAILGREDVEETTKRFLDQIGMTKSVIPKNLIATRGQKPCSKITSPFSKKP